jgi:predicted transcriptional regulator
MATSDSKPLNSISLAAEIVAAFVANNHLQANDLPRRNLT